jgi:hypothetical protein
MVENSMTFDDEMAELVALANNCLNEGGRSQELVRVIRAKMSCGLIEARDLMLYCLKKLPENVKARELLAWWQEVKAQG